MQWGRALLSRPSFIEVEAKFRFEAAAVARLRGATGAREVGRRAFTDEYFDTRDYALTRRDVWVRRREGEWQAKVGARERGDGVDVYEEVEGKEAVREVVKDAGALESFVTLRTERRSLEVPFSGRVVRVDLDEVSPYDYRIGECEVQASSDSGVEEARGLVRSFCAHFALDCSPPMYGKVLAALKDHRPEHFAALERSGLVGAKVFHSPA